MKKFYLRLALIVTAVLFISACGGGGGDSSESDAGASSAPTITGYNPTSGPSGTTVTITGNNFSTTPADNTVRFNGIAATVTAATSTELTVTTPSNISTGTISVQTTDGVATSAYSFIVSPGVPVITRFSPTYGAPGKTVTITGTNFSATPTDNTVWFNGFAATVTATTATSLLVTVPSSAVTGKISAKTAGGIATSSNSFTVLPTIASFSPTSGAPGDTVTITGSNFGAQDKVYFSSSKWAQVTARTGTSLTVTVPNNILTGKIMIITADGMGVSSAGNFVLDNAAKITSFAPTYGPAGTRVTIFGSNFGLMPRDNVVKFSGVTATVIAVSSDYMWVTVPSGPNGIGKISITTTGGTGVSADNFSVSETEPPLPNNRLSVSPTSISFGSHTLGDYFFERVNLTNTGTVNLHISGAEVSSAVSGNFEYRGTDCYGYNYMLEYYDTLAPGASCYVDIGFNPVVGTTTGTLSVTSTATGSPHTVSLGGAGVEPLAPVVSFSHAYLSFAAQELGTSSAPQKVTLTNTGTAALDIAGLGVGGYYTETNDCPPSLAIGDSCDIFVTFKPLGLAGGSPGFVSFGSNAKGSPHSMKLYGVGSLSPSGKLTLSTYVPSGVRSVTVGGHYIGDLGTPDSFTKATLTLSPGTYTVDAFNPNFSIIPATVTVTEDGHTYHQIAGTSTCLPPKFISNDVCYSYTPPVCTSPQVLQNGECVTPGTISDIGTGSDGFGADGGMAGNFVNTGGGTDAASCLRFGFLTATSASQDSQTIENICSFPVYVMRCHSPSTLPGTADTQCNSENGHTDGFYQQFHWLKPGEVESNFYSLPPWTTIWYGACSGGDLPSGKEVSLTGDYICK